ncbi:MAG: 4-hydroxybutyrate--acetyl-CoA CoA transferase, partial [Acholeplasmataceae bacterium]|nr:4-hydroxybutyrate--acetyl-CoA CoA transferase [Acholeplasmataceae bacterium]
MKTPKIITVEDAIHLVKDNDVIVFAMAAAEPKAFIQQLHKISDRVKNVRITNCLPIENGEFFVNPEYKNTFSIDSWFYAASLRKAHDHGHISYIPNHLHLAGKKRLEHVKTSIFVGTSSLPNKHGYVSLSLSNVYEKDAIKDADLVILEINPHMPRTFGDLELHISEADYLIEVNYKAPELADTEPNEKDMAIGKLIAAKIKDGSTMQCGIGGIPNAVVKLLMDKKDLGIHTEMFTTGLMKLVKAGAATGMKKNTHIGKHVCCFAMGTQE